MGKEDDKLFKACRTLNVELAREAIAEGAKVNAYAPHQDVDFVCYNISNTKGLAYPPLCLLAMHATDRALDQRSCELAVLLLDAGADIGLQDEGDEFQNTCLHWAIVNCNAALSRLLIERNAQQENINKISHPEHAHNTPLILSFKVALGASLSYRDNSFMTTIPLLLLKHGAETAYSDLHCQTALHWAAIVKAPLEVITGLLECGAKPFRKNLFGFSPIDLYKQAICLGNPAAVESGNFKVENGSFAELWYHLPSLHQFKHMEAKYLQRLNERHPIDPSVIALFAQKQEQENQRIAGIRAQSFLPPSRSVSAESTAAVPEANRNNIHSSNI